MIYHWELHNSKSDYLEVDSNELNSRNSISEFLLITQEESIFNNYVLKTKLI